MGHLGKQSDLNSHTQNSSRVKATCTLVGTCKCGCPCKKSFKLWLKLIHQGFRFVTLNCVDWHHFQPNIFQVNVHPRDFIHIPMIRRPLLLQLLGDLAQKKHHSVVVQAMRHLLSRIDNMAASPLQQHRRGSTEATGNM